MFGPLYDQIQNMCFGSMASLKFENISINKHWENIFSAEIVCFWQWFGYYQVENFNQTQWIFISLADRVVIAWQAFGWEKDHRGSEQGEGIFFGLRGLKLAMMSLENACLKSL